MPNTPRSFCAPNIKGFHGNLREIPRSCLSKKEIKILGSTENNRLYFRSEGAPSRGSERRCSTASSHGTYVSPSAVPTSSRNQPSPPCHESPLSPHGNPAPFHRPSHPCRSCLSKARMRMRPKGMQHRLTTSRALHPPPNSCSPARPRGPPSCAKRSSSSSSRRLSRRGVQNRGCIPRHTGAALTSPRTARSRPVPRWPGTRAPPPHPAEGGGVLSGWLCRGGGRGGGAGNPGR